MRLSQLNTLAQSLPGRAPTLSKPSSATNSMATAFPSRKVSLVELACHAKRHHDLDLKPQIQIPILGEAHTREMDPWICHTVSPTHVPNTFCCRLSAPLSQCCHEVGRDTSHWWFMMQCDRQWTVSTCPECNHVKCRDCVPLWEEVWGERGEGNGGKVVGVGIELGWWVVDLWTGAYDCVLYLHACLFAVGNLGFGFFGFFGIEMACLLACFRLHLRIVIKLMILTWCIDDSTVWRFDTIF